VTSVPNSIRGVPAAFTALLVDYGGVLTHPTVQATRDWCARVGITYRQFVGPLITPPDGGGPSLIEALETGRLPVAEFEQRLGAAITAGSGVEVDTHDFVRRVVGAGERLEEDMLAAVGAARERGLRTGLLSNSWGNDYPLEQLRPLFDDLVISGDVGLRKPDPAIYVLAAERLGVDPAGCLFVDDLKANVTAAEAVGMTGIRHVDAVTTRAELDRLLA
jgi:epoxide hydrolase-like predicted phosphatase